VESTCSSGKVRHKTEEAARHAARQSMLFRDAPQLEVYYCLYCYGWHLTSRIDKRKNKRKAK
jgi:hypothetical protein